MYNIAIYPRSNRLIKFNLCNVYRSIQHAAARVEAAGRTISDYEWSYVQQYAEVLASDTDPTVQGLALGLLYLHLSRLGKDSAQ